MAEYTIHEHGVGGWVAALHIGGPITGITISCNKYRTFEENKEEVIRIYNLLKQTSYVTKV